MLRPFSDVISDYIAYWNNFYINPFFYVVVLFILINAFLLILWINKKYKKSKIIEAQNKENIEAISGEDVIATQLDMAKAYIELGDKKLARDLLLHIIKKGLPHEKRQAEDLISKFTN